MVYIPRILILDKGGQGHTLVTEADLATVEGPLVILGEPGIGKTALTRQLVDQLDGVRIHASAFLRLPNLAAVRGDHAGPILIDGLDEVTATSGSSAVSEILGRLAELGNPPFALACRAADWSGASAKHLIREFYGADARTLHLEPLTFEQSVQLLEAHFPEVDAPEVLRDLDDRSLGDLAGNPLTLRLIGELAAQRATLPQSKVELLDEAAKVLVREENPGHQSLASNSLDRTDLLLSAGAISAVLILTGSAGIWTGPPQATPQGYLPIASIVGLPGAELAQDALKTRLFSSEGEDRHVPIHRVIAEILGARWLASRLEDGASQRRVVQLLLFGDGVPTSLRGLHAWLAHFHRSVREQFIQRDPYGVLRYGETGQLSDPEAAALLRALSRLAEEDPYFRSEDWSGSATGLAREALKDEIISLVTARGRHFHLSSLLLNSIPNTPLARLITAELAQIVHDQNAYYVERAKAVDGLLSSGAEVNWGSMLEALSSEAGEDGPRLALNIIKKVGDTEFAPASVIDVLLKFERIDEEEDDDRRTPRMVGEAARIFRSTSDEAAPGYLDELARRLEPRLRGIHWEAKIDLRGVIEILVEKASRGIPELDPAHFWRWVRMISGERGRNELQIVKGRLEAFPEFRRAVQWAALTDNDLDDAASWSIFILLPEAGVGLSITQADAADFLGRIAEKEHLEEADEELWAQLVRAHFGQEGMAPVVRAAVEQGTSKHASLAERWNELSRPPTKDWRKEEEKRAKRETRRREAKYAKHRDVLRPLIPKLETAEEWGALVNPANAYLGRFWDTPQEGEPQEKLTAFLGADISEAAMKGFVAFLDRDDLPTAREIAEVHAESKSFHSEAIMRAGALEMLRNGASLEELPAKTQAALLSSWWQFPEQNERKTGTDLGGILEEVIFSDPVRTEAFLRDSIEPELASDAQHISGLHRLGQTPRIRTLGARLAMEWLGNFPSVRHGTLIQLAGLALDDTHREELATLAADRLKGDLSDDVRRTWIGVRFIADFEQSKEELATAIAADPETIWSIRSAMRGDDFAPRGLRSLSVAQLEFLVRGYGVAWPRVDRPTAGWGSSNAWNAGDFVEACIKALGALTTPAATEALERLVDSGGPYSELLRHTRSRQLRERLDKDYEPLGPEDVRTAVSNSPPSTPDDLKAVVLDQLETVKDYLRGGPTDGWRQFWQGEAPADENYCRDRLADLLDPRIPPGFKLHPESLMPEQKRADLVVDGPKLALPIEIKGQWHPELWSAHLTQLDELYTRHWQAKGRGIYLVFWFGPDQTIGRHPEALASPATPDDLQRMLVDRLSPSDRGRIDVVVVDVSIGKETQKRQARRAVKKARKAARPAAPKRAPKLQ